jgi:c(7)-type cytochrome triheme protein
MKRVLLVAAALALTLVVAARAEYGDVLLNDRSETGGMRPVIFPHWFHRTVFKCQVCHVELGVKMQVGSNRITMADIYRGRYCGECHNGTTAWGIENNCDRCHSGRKGMPTGVQGRHRTTGPGYW